MDSARAVRARFATVPRPVALRVDLRGDGTGRVTSRPAGIDCGSDCRARFPAGGAVALGAVARGTSRFEGWSGGGCRGTRWCTVSLRRRAVTVVATFTVAEQPSETETLTVTRTGEGGGTVASVPAGIACPPSCQTSLPRGTELLLNAAADQASTFAGWTGAGCSGTAECRVTLDGSQAVEARFEPATPSRPTLTTATAGAFGSVRPACPSGCLYDRGASVTVLAAAGRGNRIAGWAGCTPATPTSRTCTVAMTGDRTVTVTFEQVPEPEPEPGPEPGPEPEPQPVP
jgi:hypothetical protein